MAEHDGFVRNFRSAYYEKVGFCGIEEEKALDSILNSSPPDFEKLGDFCSRFDLARRREEVWKLLLGVQCYNKNPFDDESKVVNRIRNEHFEFLVHHVEHLLCHNIVIRKRLIQLCSSKLKNYNHHNNRLLRENNEQLKVRNNTSNKQLEEENRQSDKLDKNVSKEGKDILNTSNIVSPTTVDQILHDCVDDGNENRRPSDMSLSSLENQAADIATTTKNISIFDLSCNDAILDRETVLAWSQANKGQHVALMYLLETGRLNSKNVDKLDPVECNVYIAMASIFVKISKNLQTAFFLFKSFLRKLEQNEDFMMMQYKQCLNDLSKDMPRLNLHIRSVCENNLENLPCWYWFRYCYIDIAEDKAILRLWDKFISGCLKCTSKIFKVILTKLEPMILSCESYESICQLLIDREKFCLKEFPQNPQS